MHTTWTNAMQAMAELGIDASYRQIDYWCSQGLLGDEKARRGSGWRREFDLRDLELIDALANVRKLSRDIDITMVADIVRCRPLNPDGEILILEADGTAHRFDHWCAIPAELVAGVCVIPLRSFAMAGSSTATGESPPVVPQPAGEPGAAASPTAVPTSP